MAIGNPSASAARLPPVSVSARTRDIHSGPYDDFLQPDASINQGNSGGPTLQPWTAR